MPDQAPQTLDNTPPVGSKDRPGKWRIQDIVDGRKLRVQLSAAALDNISDMAAARSRALDLLHASLFRGRIIAQERLQQGADGLDTARLLSSVQDEVIAALFDFTTTHVFRARNPTEGERLAVFATGGYGRGVLAPSSDIDLLFLRQYKVSPWAESVIEFMLYALWDMGLKVGHAFRTIDGCVSLAKDDVTIKTSLLDARFLFGDDPLGKALVDKFQTACIDGKDASFIADKLAERDARHLRQGNTRYVVEPNVKEGKGGLRDLQTLYWIAKHLYGGTTLESVMKRGIFTSSEYRIFIRAARFFWTVRCHLHYLTGRPEERISFDLQPELASRLGYQDRGDQLGVERFMKRYFVAAKDVGGLSRILAAKLQIEQARNPQGLKRLLPRPAPKAFQDTGFMIDNGLLSIAAPSSFEEAPERLLALFATAAKENLDIHPDAMSAAARSVKAFRPAMRRTPEARALFLSCLLETPEPARILRLMNETGVLGRVLPEFGGIVAQTQFNMYHHYTVDEHTLRAVEIMSDIEHGRSEHHSHATKLFQSIQNRRALYLAMLLHDTGKGKGDQQVEGMRTARAACKRLGLPTAEVELVAWLVGNHLEMSETAQKRDISDPRTVAGFADLVGSIERLTLLHILTAADITAVGPKVWNGWKGQLLSDLHHNTVAALRGGRTDEGAVAADLSERAEQRRSDLQEARGAIPPIMAEMEPAYWIGFDLETLNRHAEALKVGDALHVSADIRADKGSVTLLVSGPDRIGLFATLVAAIASQGASIASAQVFTSTRGQIIDVFTLQDSEGGPFAEGDANRLDALVACVADALAGRSQPEPQKRRKHRREAAFVVEPSVEIDTAASRDFTVIDIAARDRPGLLLDVARTLAELNLSIHSAHVGSYGERVFDAFYIRTEDGEKLTDPHAKAYLRERLLRVFIRNEPDAPTTPTRRLARARAADSF
ncbi:MAG: [protein-PII] uridylyltransferase [Pseudomonadota bacterium]